MKGERAATRQSLFREVNERIRELLDEHGVGAVCECVDEACAEPLHVTKEEYERVRAVPTHFLVRPGHVEPDVERVVGGDGDRYAVVEKLAAAAAAAERFDPRSRTPAKPAA